MIRWTTAALLAGLLAGGILYDRVEHAAQPEQAKEAAPTVTPALSDRPLLSSDWYCPIGSTAVEGFATHTVYVTNMSEDAAFATVETLTDTGAGPSLQFDLAPHATETIELATLADSPVLGAVVEVIGGEGVVGHQVLTSAGLTEGPCSTATSDQWFFGGGITTRDADYFLALMNPSSNAVVFDASFRTETRSRDPKDLQSAVVPPRSVRLINVSDLVAREQIVSAEIRTVQGNLVVERLQTFDGTLGPAGATLQLGVADASTTWAFPSGVLSEDSDNHLAIYNPGDTTTEVDVFFDPIDPQDRVIYGLLPRELTIDPGRTVLVDIANSANEIGLILPYELGLRVESANGVPVVAEHWQLSPGVDETLIGAGGENAKVKIARNPMLLNRQDGDTGEVPEEELEHDHGEEESVSSGPRLVPSQGVASDRGIESTSTRWVIPWITIAENGGTELVLSAGSEGASIQATLLVAGEWQPPLRAVVGPDARLVLPLDSAATGAPILITSDTPIVVQAHVIVPGERHDIVSGIPTLAR